MSEGVIYGLLAALMFIGGGLLALLALIAFCCTMDVDSSLENAALWGVPSLVLFCVGAWLVTLARKRR
jgi:hypothetical protein